MSNDKSGENECITRTGLTGRQIYSLPVAFVEADIGDLAIIIPPEHLKAALWEPEVSSEAVVSNDPWGQWTWGFYLKSGLEAQLINQGGHRWVVWISDADETEDVIAALLDVVSAVGFSFDISATCGWAMRQR